MEIGEFWGLVLSIEVDGMKTGIIRSFLKRKVTRWKKRKR